jgi:hypothetical protein
MRHRRRVLRQRYYLLGTGVTTVRESQDWQCGVEVPQAGHELRSTQRRYPAIRDDQVESGLFGETPGLEAVRGFDHFVFPEAERAGGDATEGVLVVDEQNAPFGGRGMISPPLNPTLRYLGWRSVPAYPCPAWSGRRIYRAHTPLEWVAGETGVTVRERRALLRAIGRLPKCGKGVAIGAALGGLLGALGKGTDRRSDRRRCGGVRRRIDLLPTGGAPNRAYDLRTTGHLSWAVQR